MTSLLIRRRRVVAPGAHPWTVGASWLPRPRKPAQMEDWRRHDDGLWRLIDNEPSSLRHQGGCLLLWLELVVALLAFVVNVLASFVAIAVLLVARVVFRRPWVVVARGEETTVEWEVVGWQATQRLIDDVAVRLDRGESLDGVELA